MGKNEEQSVSDAFQALDLWHAQVNKWMQWRGGAAATSTDSGSAPSALVVPSFISKSLKCEHTAERAFSWSDTASPPAPPSITFTPLDFAVNASSRWARLCFCTFWKDLLTGSDHQRGPRCQITTNMIYQSLSLCLIAINKSYYTVQALQPLHFFIVYFTLQELDAALILPCLLYVKWKLSVRILLCVWGGLVRRSLLTERKQHEGKTFL